MSRRGAGEGTFRQRKDGTWEGRITINGKQKSFYAKSYKECQQKLNTARRLVEQGLPLSDERLTVNQFLKDWLESVRHSLRPSTYASYESIIRLHIIPELGKVKLARLTPRQVQSLLNVKLKAGLSPRRCEYIYAVLRRSLGQAEKWGLVARNVAALTTPPRPKKKVQKFLTLEQAQSLLDAAKQDSLEALMLVAMSTGLRRGELLALRWQDIDDAGTLRVRHTLQRVDGKICLMDPKSIAGLRTIALSDVALEALKQHRKHQVQDRLIAGPKWKEGDFVFASSVGTPLCGDNLLKRFKKLLKAAELPDIRFHDLRHTACSFLAAQGVDIVTAKELMGHSQVSLTANVYSHALDESKRKAAVKMNELFQGKSSSL